MQRRAFLGRLGMAVLSVGCWRRAAYAQDSAVAVVYPQLAEPYQTVFAQIVEGIREGVGPQTISLRLGIDVEGSVLGSHLRQRGIRKVVLLGRQAIKTATGLGPDMQLVLGGALLIPSADTPTAAAISLTPDTEQLFSLLQQLAPRVRRVLTVYSRAQSGWLMASAQDAARLRGLELIAAPAEDIRSAVKLYANHLEAINAASDALWLLQDSNTVDDALVLPLVLRAAWDKNFVVFSSSLPHVKKGALFSLYPDNRGLGRELAALLSSSSPGLIRTAKSLKRALNTRTAAHLGLQVQRSQFDAVFPEQ